jgi:2-hydroxy-3-keto-5-methylthiopentenyl-1-phosphate phosphatase
VRYLQSDNLESKAHNAHRKGILNRTNLLFGRAENLMNLVVLCDFDGTITTIDTAEFVLARFARGDWRLFDRQFQNGEITLEECLNKQFSLVRASKKQILEELMKVVTFRQSFKKLAEYCKENRFPLIIVSAGLDFVIEHFLKLNDCLDLVEIYAPKTAFGANGIRFTFPTLFNRSSDNFKHDLVKHYRSQHKEVMYIGDGLADYEAAKDACCSFAIGGSRLAKLCKSHGIPCRNTTDFRKVIEAIQEIESYEAQKQLSTRKNEK